jgi:hypothetical protein
MIGLYRSRNKIPHTRNTSKNCRRALFFPSRQAYIRSIAPFLELSEVAFKEEFETKRKVSYISKNDRSIREVLFNVPALNGSRLERIPTHAWSRVLYLQGTPSPFWGLPCFKCEFLHFSMANYETRGQKCTEWRREYEVLNCAEPMCISMILRHERDGGELYR